jgi:WD40 repeat protein
VATGEPVGGPLWHPVAVTALGISPDGATIISGGDDGLIRLWDAATDRLLDARAFHEGWVTSVAIGADGRTLLTGARGDRTARLWDLGRSGSRPVARSSDGRDRTPADVPGRSGASARLRFQNVAYSPDRKMALTGTGNGLAQQWETATGRPIGTPLRHPHPNVRVVAFSPDGNQVGTACHDYPPSVACAARVWDAATGRPLSPWLPQRNWVAALAFSPDGKILATGDYSHGVHLWDAATGQRVGQPLRQRDIVLSLAFRPDGRALVAGTAHDWNRDPQARLWDVTTGEPIGEPLKHAGYVVFLAFTPDGRTLVTGSLDNTFRLWDAGTGAPRSDYRTITKGWRCAALSPLGDLLVTAGGDGTARLWSTANGTAIQGATLPHPREVPAVAAAFSPDGRLLVVGHEDGSAQLWDVTTCKSLGPPVVQHGKLLGVAFRPDGQSFLTTAEDGSTRAWPVPTPLAEADLDRITLLLEVHTAQRLDEGQTVARLTPEEWRQRYQQVVGQENAPAVWTAPRPTELDWHDARARDAEQTGQPFTARWHLDRLIAQRRNDWLLYARRARTWSEEEKWDLADADQERAAARGPTEGVLAWYRHRAVVCQSRWQWSAALWYLERLVRVSGGGGPPTPARGSSGAARQDREMNSGRGAFQFFPGGHQSMRAGSRSVAARRQRGTARRSPTRQRGNVQG